MNVDAIADPGSPGQVNGGRVRELDLETSRDVHDAAEVERTGIDRINVEVAHDDIFTISTERLTVRRTEDHLRTWLVTAQLQQQRMEDLRRHVVADNSEVLDALQAAQVHTREIGVVANGEAPREVVQRRCVQKVHGAVVRDVEVTVHLFGDGRLSSST